jgi:hypothetical protein
MRAARINSARIIIVTVDPFIHASNLWIAAIGSAFVIIVTILWRGDTSFLQIASTVQASGSTTLIHELALSVEAFVECTRIVVIADHRSIHATCLSIACINGARIIVVTSCAGWGVNTAKLFIASIDSASNVVVTYHGGDDASLLNITSCSGASVWS